MSLSKEIRTKILKDVGIEYDEQDGFEVEDMQGYFKREAMENALEAGEFIPGVELSEPLCQEAKDIYRRQKNEEFVELIRNWRMEYDAEGKPTVPVFGKPLDPLILGIETPEERFKRLEALFNN